MARYRIKNWREYQHYKGRNPPWIKLHSQAFASKDWVMLADASRLTMIVCMVVASMDNEGDGSFDGDPDFLQRVARLDVTPNLQPLIDSGFLELASTCKHLQAKDTPSVSVSVSEGGVGGNKVDSVFQFLPEIYDTEGFRLAWNNWEQYHRTVHHRAIQPIQRLPAWTALQEKFGDNVTEAIAAINRAIAAGWKTIHRPDGFTKAEQAKPVRTPGSEVEAYLAKQAEAERQWKARRGINSEQGGKGETHAA